MIEMHPWKARLFVGITMLVLAFIGLVITDVKSSGGWDFWLWVTPVYALLALWLSWYLRRQSHSLSLVSIWHEILHWAILGASVILVSVFVSEGILGRLIAGLFVLTLISQSVLLAGIYIDSTFFAIGLTMALFSWLVAATTEYLYAFAVPLLLIGIGIAALFIWRSHKKSNNLSP